MKETWGSICKRFRGWFLPTPSASSSAEVTHPPSPPPAIGPYRLLQPLRTPIAGDRRGIYLAQSPTEARCVVLKLLSESQASTLELQRFEREIRVLAMLENPHSVRLVKAGSEHGFRYCALEAVSGLTVAELVESCDGRLRDGRAIELLRHACRAMAEVHRLGFIHRDIKPANLQVSCRGGEADWLTVLDFGLAEPVAAMQEPSAVASSNQISGTPAYISPEAATLARPLDARTDIYSLGCVAYYMLSGRPPFDAINPVELCWKHAQHAPPSLESVLNIPAADDLQQLIMSCLAKSPEERPQSMSELHARLDAVSPLHPWSRTDAEQWWRDAQQRD